MKYVAILILILLSVPIHAKQFEHEIAIAMELVRTAEQPEQTILVPHVATPHKRPGCEWVAPAKKDSTSEIASPSQRPAKSVSSTPPPAESAEAIDARPTKATESAPQQVEWTTWQKAEKDDLPTLYFFSTDWCMYCPAMLQRINAAAEHLQGWSAVKLGEAESRLWHVGSFPSIILADVSQSRRREINGLISVEKLVKAIRDFSIVQEDAYYPLRRTNWTLDGRLVDGEHLLKHHKHNWRNYDPNYIRWLDFKEVNSLHSADHDEQIGRGRIDRRYAKFRK